eukprot:TRINITY_DN25218_c0_g1_i1.p1 TRINITY_DN25218_c0_g1~~TRINITY_DN25218_c0_g1_i1.p1  ORF type:complete len:221 (-),score=43.38 TRINITY_DN25218_c0_g1_i1:106-768(-)
MDSSSYKRQRKGSVIVSKERKVSNPLLIITPASGRDESLLKYQSQLQSSDSLAEAEIVLIELNYYYGLVKRQLIKYQSPFTGLFPATSSTKNVGSVKESIYSAMAIWSLHLAYRNLDFDKGKGTELKGHVVNCIRGIMTCWMKQCTKIEAFKKKQCPENSLHSKFNIETGEPIYSFKSTTIFKSMLCLSMYFFSAKSFLQGSTLYTPRKRFASFKTLYIT